jgi:Ras-related protein Rab-1A
MVTSQQPYYLKFLMIGDSDVGKTTLLNCFVEERYDEKYSATIGVDFKNKSIKYKDCLVKLQIWDTAGQERFRTLTKSYYKIVNGVVLVFDITNRESFNNIRYWLDQVKENTDDKMKIILVGNKIDMENRNVSIEEADSFAKKNDIKYFETSSKKNLNVHTVFSSLTEDIMPLLYEGTDENKIYDKLVLRRSSDVTNIKSLNSQTNKSDGCCL